MLNRRHIKAPKTFKPGPGFPAERLAYMSPAEMELLRTLTDGTIDRGPKGIPSFAITTGKTTGTTVTSGGSTSTTSRSSGPGGGSLQSPVRTENSKGGGTSSATIGSKGGGASTQRAGAGGNAGPVAAKAPSAVSSTARIGSAASAQRASATAPSSSVTTRSVASATGGSNTRTVNAPSPGLPSANVPVASAAGRAPQGTDTTSRKTATASALSPAQKNAYTQAGRLIGQPAGNTANFPGQGTTPRSPIMQTPMRPNAMTDTSEVYKRSTPGVGRDNWVTGQLARNMGWGDDQSALDRVSNAIRTVAGEAGAENAMGRDAVANVISNRIARGQGLAGFDANGFDRARVSGPNQAYRDAVPGSPGYAKGAEAMLNARNLYSAFNETAPDKLKTADHYVAASRERATDWARGDNWNNSRTALGNHVFGTPNNNLSRIQQTRESLFPQAPAGNAAPAPQKRASAAEGGVQLASYSPGAPASGNVPITTQKQPGRLSTPKLDGIQPQVLNAWQNTLNAFGRSVPIVSGYRDAATNAAAGGVKKSQHLDGNAIDVKVAGMSRVEQARLIQAAQANGFTGFGIGPTSIHMDMGRPRSWGYGTKDGAAPQWAKDLLASGQRPAATAASNVSIPRGVSILDLGKIDQNAIRDRVNQAGQVIKQYAGYASNPLTKVIADSVARPIMQKAAVSGVQWLKDTMRGDPAASRAYLAARYGGIAPGAISGLNNPTGGALYAPARQDASAPPVARNRGLAENDGSRNGTVFIEAPRAPVRSVAGPAAPDPGMNWSLTDNSIPAPPLALTPAQRAEVLRRLLGEEWFA